MLCQLLLVMGLCTLPFGCGYQLAGSGELPGGVKTLAVNMLTNRSSETGVETVMTNALIDEISWRRQIVVTDTASADGILTGTIESLGWETVARKSAHTSTQRRVRITLSLKLSDPNGDVLWQTQQVRAEQTYNVADENVDSELNRRQAISMLAKRLAEIVYQRLTQDF